MQKILWALQLLSGLKRMDKETTQQSIGWEKKIIHQEREEREHEKLKLGFILMDIHQFRSE